MAELIFDTPWWLPAAIAVVGVAVFVSGNKRVEARTQYAGAGLVLLALLLTLVSFLVDTDVEKVTTRTRQLVDAVGKKDWPRLQSMLDEQTSLAFLNNRAAMYVDRGAIVSAAQRAAERYGLQSASILSLQARQNDTLITVDISAYSFQEYTQGRPILSSWQLDWQQTGDDWLLSRITALKIGPQSAAKVRPP